MARRKSRLYGVVSVALVSVIPMGAQAQSLPVADAGFDQSATEGDTVHAERKSLSQPRRWKKPHLQLAKYRLSVLLPKVVNTDSPTLVAPDLTANCAVSFVLTVTDSDGNEATDFVAVRSIDGLISRVCSLGA